MNPLPNCSTVRTQLADHLRGQLPPSEALALEQHLRHCPACREALLLEQRLRANAGLRIAAPTDFAAAVLAQTARRPSPAGRMVAMLRGLAADTAFRAFVDPLLRLDLHLRDAGTPLWQRVTSPLTSLQLQLQAEGLKLCEYLALTLLHAGRQVRLALAGSIDSQ